LAYLGDLAEAVIEVDMAASMIDEAFLATPDCAPLRPWTVPNEGTITTFTNGTFAIGSDVTPPTTSRRS
jgi:hypothetical protein